MTTMDRQTYIELLRDVTSGDPARVRDANRVLYSQLVGSPTDADARLMGVAERNERVNYREADLCLAEAAE